MKSNKLGIDGPEVTEVGLGCWQLGGGWSDEWNNETAQKILHTAYENGVRFFDTADVYGIGNSESEKSISQFLKDHPDVKVATKLGRNKDLFPDNYTAETLLDATKESIGRLGIERLDLTQLHCIPKAELIKGDVFEFLRKQKKDGLISAFGVSVETVEEGLICLEHEGVDSLQVIFNIFRQKLLDELLPKAKEKGVGIIVRLPLASGMLSGKFGANTKFNEHDHRNFNKDGEVFNVGETFAGIQYDKGLELVDELKSFVPDGMTMAQFALRWILDFDSVSTVIPGASKPEQAKSNAEAASLPPLGENLHKKLSEFYKTKVHDNVRGAY